MTNTFQQGTIVEVVIPDPSTVNMANTFARGTVVKVILVDQNGNPSNFNTFLESLPKTNPNDGTPYLNNGVVTVSTALPAYTAALARVRAGSGDARILAVGDSTTAGNGSSQGTTTPYRTSWTASFASGLASVQGVSVSVAAIAPPDGGNVNTEWSVASSSWTTGGFGFTSSIQSDTVGDVATYSPATNSDTYDVYYLTESGGGTFTARATGGTLATVSANGAGGIAKVTISAGAASTSNVVTLTHTVAGTVWVVAVQPRLATTRQVLIANVGAGGSTTAQWASGTGAYGPINSLGAITTYAPDLTIIMLGINDARAGVTAGAVSANLQTLITAAQASGDVLLCSIVPSSSTDQGGSTYTAEQGYYPGYGTLAGSARCVYADVWQAFGGAYDTAKMADQYHPNDSGYALLAQTILGRL